MKKSKIRKLKNVLYMGCYTDDFRRNDITLQGLRKNNVNVIEYNIKTHNIIKNVKLFIKNFKKLKYQKCDLILLRTEAHIQFYLAKLLSFIKRVPLIHDIFISKLQTIYYDRKQFKKRKIPKFMLFLILYYVDFIECKFADYIVLDTYSHIKYFHDRFNISIKKFRKVLLGTIDNLFYPLEKRKEDNDKFIVGFVGSFIPLQGVEYIIRAAKILENQDQIIFHIVGKGQTYDEIRKLANELNLKNTIFLGTVPLIDLPKFISKFDIELGIFGNTKKATEVIAHKIFDGIAMKRPMITCDTPAIRELFTHNKDIFLCEQANPQSLAEAILKLKNDKVLRDKIAENSYNLFLKYCNIDAIGKSWKATLNEILNKN